MSEIFAEQTTLKSVYTPLSLMPHIIFCAVATLVYLALYFRKGSVHYLLLMLAIDATLITQFWTSSAMIAFLGTLEVVLLGATIFFHIKFAKKVKAENKAKEAARKEAEEKAKEAKDIEKEKEKKIVENAFDGED